MPGLPDLTVYPFLLRTVQPPLAEVEGKRRQGLRRIGKRLVLHLMIAGNMLSGDISGWPRLLIHLLMAAFLVSCVLREDHHLAKPLGWGLVKRIGEISYGIYLLHLFTRHGASATLLKLGHDGQSSWALFALCLVFSTLVCEVSFRFYETPCLNLKKRFHRAPGG